MTKKEQANKPAFISFRKKKVFEWISIIADTTASLRKNIYITRTNEMPQIIKGGGSNGRESKEGRGEG